MNTSLLPKSVGIFLLLFAVICGLYFARDFLIPIAFAGIFSMLFLPFSRQLEKKGVSRGLASLMCILLLIALVAGIVALISWQVSNLSEDFGKMQERITKMVEQVRNYVVQKLGISTEKQKQMLEAPASGASGKATAVLGSLMNIFVKFILVLVYIFLFMFFRPHLKKFILKLVPADQKQNAENTIQNSTKVAQQYLTGIAMMIGCLWIMYGIGFSIVGVKNALFFAVLCGLLEIVPFIGNITGTLLTVLMAVAQGGGNNMIIGIVITYLVIQFLQTYLLEPLVVGAEVNINPLFTIIAIVAGEMLWGIPGMVLAIPLMGILKIVFDHVEPLKPYGFLIGGEKKKRKAPQFVERIKKARSTRASVK